jgi:hypothetical protein
MVMAMPSRTVFCKLSRGFFIPLPFAISLN